MPTLYPVAGCRFYIGPAVNLPDGDVLASDFASLTWTEVKGWQSMGPAGDVASVITTQLIDTARDIKQKGTRNAGQQQNAFAVIPTDPGQIAIIAAETKDDNFAIRQMMNDAPVPRSFVATISQASPGVVTKVAHGLAAGDTITLSTTGTLPTGLSPATTYFVKTVLSADTFTLAATADGAAINTTGAGSGVHTVTTVPFNSERLFMGLVMSAPEAGGQANTVRLLNVNIEINTNIVRKPRSSA